MNCKYCNKEIPPTDVQQGGMHYSCYNEPIVVYKAFHVWDNKLDAEHEKSTLNGEGFNIELLEFEMSRGAFLNMKEGYGY